MNLPTVSRRTGLGLGVAAMYSGLGALGEALAQTAQAPAPARDWLAMVRQHHDLLERAFEELLSPNQASYERANLQMRNLNQLLSAHSLAEETIIYPALARAGMMSEAEKLYMEEAHMKMLKAQAELALRAQQANADWREPTRKLRDLVLTHAREHEEKNLFPKLQKALSPQQNQMINELYPAEFARVLPRQT